MEIRFKVRSRCYRGYSGYSGYSGAIEGCMRGIIYSGVAVDSMDLLL